MTPAHAHHLGYSLARDGKPARVPTEHLEAMSDECFFEFFHGYSQGRSAMERPKEIAA